MSKRSSNPQSSVAKKSKVEDNNFWDDDLDGEAVEDCFKRAIENNSQCNDVTLLSSYSVFQKPKNIFTSTQFSQSSVLNQSCAEDQIRQLQEKYAEKEGEASILRSNLQNLRASCHLDQERKQMEWKEKLSAFEKDSKAIKSELEFKNLEIANLKQQVSELSRLINAEHNNTQKGQTFDIKGSLPSSPEKKTNQISTENPRLYINLETGFPLKSFELLFKYRLSRNEVCIDENLEKNSVQNAADSSFNIIYQDCLSIAKWSSEELNSYEANSHIRKVVSHCYKTLKVFYNMLSKLEIKLPYQESHGRDIPNKIIQTSLICGEFLEFLGELSIFNSFVQSDLLGIFSDMPKLRNDEQQQTLSYLSVLSNILTVIGHHRIENDVYEFLSAVLKNLCKILSSNNFTCQKFSDVVPVVKQLLNLNFSFKLIVEMNGFLNVITRSSSTICSLCSKKDENEMNSDELCRFLKYIILLEDTFVKTENTNLGISVITLTYNILKSNMFLLHQESKTCECVSRLYKLALSVVYNKNQVLVLKNHVKILSLLIFNTYEVTHKYVKDIAQLKETLYSLMHRENEMDDVYLKNLEKFSSTEDFVTIRREKFHSINL